MKSFLARLLVAAASAFPLLACADYVYNTVNYPGAVFTDVRGLNNSGQIVGYASLDGLTFFAFSYAGGVFSALPPTVFGTSAHGVNDSGVIVGSANHDPGPVQGFIFNAGSYAFFSRPGWANTYARMVTNGGLVTGYSQDEAAGTSAGYIYNPFTSVFTDISPAGSLFTIAQGINNAGQVVGSAILAATGANAFLRQPDGSITLFQIGAAPTRARGINDMGLITGFMTVGGVNQGFVGTSSGFQTLMVPGSDETIPEAINNSGQVAGLYRTGGGTVTSGFIATPVEMPTGTTAGGAYTFSVAVIPNFPIFIDPPVSVGFRYRTGKHDPSFATVRLPIGIGDSLYRLKVKGRRFTVAGGELFDFRDHGFRRGVDAFTVKCIEVDAMLDPANPEAFPTEVSFVAGGRFTGTMKPIVRDSEKGDRKRCLLQDDDEDEDDED
jgi:uncharacterized membrane protein